MTTLHFIHTDASLSPCLPTFSSHPAPTLLIAYCFSFPWRPSGNYYELSSDDKALLVKQDVNAYRIEVSAGDMILWRSDLAHSNAPPQMDRAHKRRFRAVSYVSMLPASMTAPKIMKRKVMGYEGIRTTTHWANLEIWFRECAAENARFHVASKPPNLSRRQMELHGLRDYGKNEAQGQGHGHSGSNAKSGMEKEKLRK